MSTFLGWFKYLNVKIPRLIQIFKYLNVNIPWLIQIFKCQDSLVDSIPIWLFSTVCCQDSSSIWIVGKCKFHWIFWRDRIIVNPLFWLADGGTCSADTLSIQCASSGSSDRCDIDKQTEPCDVRTVSHSERLVVCSLYFFSILAALWY